MRKFLIALLAIASLAFISPCGTSGGSDSTKTTDASDSSDDKTTEPEEATTTEAESEAIPVEDWAEDFCGNFSAWLDEIKAASEGVSSQVTPGDMESAKTAIAGLFASASESTQALMTQIEEGGAPDIEDGDELIDDLISKFQGFDDAAQAAQADSEALATDDPTTFQADANALTETFQTEVNEVGDSFSEIDTKYPSEDLNDALTSSCSF